MAKKPITSNAAGTWTDELAKRWDDARTALKQVTEAAASAQAALAGLPADATAEQRTAAEVALSDANAKVTEAKAVISELAKGPKPPKAGKAPAAPRPSPGDVQAGGGSAAAPSSETVATDLVAAIALHDIRWNDRLFGAGERLEPDLPQETFDHLEADGAVRMAD